MSVNKATDAASHVGNLYIGKGSSAGGRGPSPKRIRKVGTFTATVTPTASILTQTVDVQTVPAVGVKAGDAIVAIPPVNLEANLTFCAFVSATDVITVRLGNPTAGTVTTGAKSWTFLWTQLAA